MTEYKSKAEHIRVLLKAGHVQAEIIETWGYSRGAIKHAMRTLAAGGLQKRGRKFRDQTVKTCPHCKRPMLVDAGTTSRTS